MHFWVPSIPVVKPFSDDSPSLLFQTSQLRHQATSLLTVLPLRVVATMPAQLVSEEVRPFVIVQSGRRQTGLINTDGDQVENLRWTLMHTWQYCFWSPPLLSRWTQTQSLNPAVGPNVLGCNDQSHEHGLHRVISFSSKPTPTESWISIQPLQQRKGCSGTGVDRQDRDGLCRRWCGRTRSGSCARAWSTQGQWLPYRLACFNM